ncbi:hypothetical protein Alvin_3141 (plasmid) [Allochromatium vinosum DSM 180]|uniref:Uncharacterized protein n=1 Tax=Allochromatium vinosum (strain ATCC 17899 / DSM 180 / NBRC 103801 / NCIMB 10441 / D) TaxID=572477 RepID=D3RW27_ALLVD|nr:hypothetical protein Alvin_3141 [Allochromatium vinosum DSM 180]
MIFLVPIITTIVSGLASGSIDVLTNDQKALT